MCHIFIWYKLMPGLRKVYQHTPVTRITSMTKWLLNLKWGHGSAVTQQRKVYKWGRVLTLAYRDSPSNDFWHPPNEIKCEWMWHFVKSSCKTYMVRQNMLGRNPIRILPARSARIFSRRIYRPTEMRTDTQHAWTLMTLMFKVKTLPTTGKIHH